MADDAGAEKKRKPLPKISLGKRQSSGPDAGKKKGFALPFGRKRKNDTIPPTEPEPGEEVEFMQIDEPAEGGVGDEMTTPGEAIEAEEERPEITGDPVETRSDAPEPVGEVPAVTSETLQDEPEEEVEREITIELLEEPQPEPPAPAETTRKKFQLPSLPKKEWREVTPQGAAPEASAGAGTAPAQPKKKLALLPVKLNLKFGKKKSTVTGRDTIEIAEGPKPMEKAPEPTPPIEDSPQAVAEDLPPSVSIEMEEPSQPPAQTEPEQETPVEIKPLPPAASPPSPPVARPRPAYDYEAIHGRIDEILVSRGLHMPTGAERGGQVQQAGEWAPGSSGAMPRLTSAPPRPPKIIKRSKPRVPDEPVDDRVDRILRQKGKLPPKD